MRSDYFENKQKRRIQKAIHHASVWLVVLSVLLLTGLFFGARVSCDHLIDASIHQETHEVH